MRWWETSVGGGARGRIIGLLRRAERTVEELASELGVTDNAVRAQLQLLEREGLVHQSRVRHTGSVGKPATLYAVPQGAEAYLSAAHAPLLAALLAALESRLNERELEALFRDVGRRLAEGVDGVGGSAPRELEARVKAAAAVLTALGAEIDVERTTSGYLLRGHACPLSDAVRVQPGVCRAIEELVAGVTGANVVECCDRSGSSKCCFDVRRSA
jgi:predicted ArsR family transcriptional regulator